MKNLLTVTALLLLVPVGAGAEGEALGSGFTSVASSACSAVCSAQPFDNDPFSTTWSRVNDSTLCPLYWNTDVNNNGFIGKVRGSGECVTGEKSYARFNGSISGDGCAIYQIVEDTDESGAVNLQAWQPGFVIRDPSTSSSTAFPGEIVLAVVGITTGVITATAGSSTDTDAGFGAMAVGDWLGACVYGNGVGTTVNAFHWAADPGAPATNLGGAAVGTGTGWGAPAATLTPCSTTSNCTGTPSLKWGVWMDNLPPTLPGARLQVDNFRTYSCQ